MYTFGVCFFYYLSVSFIVFYKHAIFINRVKEKEKGVIYKISSSDRLNNNTYLILILNR